MALKDIDNLLQTNFNNRDMKALVKDYLATHGVAKMEVGSYSTRIDDDYK